MLSQNAIQILATKLQTTQLNIRREYIQHLFLSYLYKESIADKLFFKGGTALRIIYSSPRFSEDLDFSTSIRNIKKIESIVLSALAEIEREGIQIELRESKKTSGGYLSIVTFQFHKTSVGVQLEISQRKNQQTGELVTIVSDFIPPYTIVRLSQTQSHWAIIRNFKSVLRQEIQRYL